MGDSKEVEFPHFQNADGQKIYCKYWPEQNPKALCFIIHGYGEHCQRYDKIASLLNSLGVYVCGHDHVGHGKSEGEQVMIDDFSIYCRDSLQHIDIMKEKFPSLPVFLMAHSMGGTIGIAMANERPEDFQVILMSPCIMFNPKDATKLMIFALKSISFCLPRFQIKKISSSGLSRDPAVAKDYDEDPLNYHGGPKADFLRKFYNATLEVIQSLPNITWPYLLQHGTVDELCYIGGSQMLFDQSKSADKTYKVYEGYYHELEKEPEEDAKKVLDDIKDWVSQRLGGNDVTDDETQDSKDISASDSKVQLVVADFQVSVND